MGLEYINGQMGLIIKDIFKTIRSMVLEKHNIKMEK